MDNKRKIKKIFPFMAVEEIRAGHGVFMLDRLNCEIVYVCNMTVGALAQIINDKDEAERYEFWYVEREEENG